MGSPRRTIVVDSLTADRCVATASSATLKATTDVATVVVTAGSDVVTKPGFDFAGTGIAVGQRLTGTGIPAGAVVRTVLPGEVRMSAPASASGTVTVGFYVQTFTEAGFAQGWRITGTGLDAAATISAVAADGFSLTMSAVATASGTITATQRTHIVATATVKSPAVRCHGERGVVFLAQTMTGDTDTTVSAGAEGSLDDGVTFAAVSATYTDSQSGFTTASLAGGQGLIVAPRAPHPGLAYTHLRLSIVGNGSAQIDSVRIDATVL